MTNLPDPIEQLSSRVEALEKRVTNLEHQRAPVTETPLAVETLPAAPAVAAEKSATPAEASSIPVIGKALLGIAGAYVLRALTSDTSLPRTLITVVAILYALAWLLAAARAVARNRLAGALYAATSALILAPMLWEMCLRFQVLSPSMAAVVLTVYVAAATVIAFRNHRSSAFTFAYTGAAITAIALSIGTHHMAAFTIILLAMLAICEGARLRGLSLVVRPVIALAADFAVWALLFIYQAAPGARTDYPDLAPIVLLGFGFSLFAVTAAGLVYHTLYRKRSMSGIDIVQAVASFLLAAFALQAAFSSGGTVAAGILCLLAAAACYAVGLGPFRRAPERMNFRVCSIWSAALLMGGLWLSLGASIGAVTLSVLALAMILLGDRLLSRVTELHGVLFLLVASVASGQIIYLSKCLVGPVPAAPGWPILVVSTCAILAYVAGDEAAGEPWQAQWLHLIPALLAACTVAALIARGLVAAIARLIEPAVFHIAFARTLAACAVALFLAFAAAHWQRIQLKRASYAALAFVAAKLLFEDLQHGRLEFIAASIVLVALTLIAVPKLSQHRAH